ncbi:LacI family DNA-binding transcriptional regulator [Streptomyces sp. NPDC102360]|uniref:LacI family DNA-binding transcriptional regulator n=1 Tax=Streptomyces sp. NPDC102360 TaxID=3366160 RepID=UPI0038208465
MAKAVGVHPGTVSRALNPATEHLVKADTVKRVRRAAKKAGYVPNPFARSLKTQRSGTLGALIPDVTNPLFPPIIRGLEQMVSQDGFSVLIANTDNMADREAGQIQDLRFRQVEGMLVATARVDDPAISGLIEDGVPVVMVNRVSGASHASSVVSDDVAGIRQALEHLRSLGHRRIAHIAGPQDTSTGRIRLRAFRSEMTDLGLEFVEELVRPENAFQVEAGQRAMGELLDRGEFTAVVAANDLLAIGAYDALRAYGLDCPGDVSVVGFNDLPFTDRIDPPLTTVRVPHFDLGREAGRFLLQMLQDKHAGRPLTVKSLLLPTTLEIRRSTGPARG